ncbi:hypothetical protein HELRODRAFT_184072 [Helobdella robusta]|uniref:WSC domain-containing protein n=1 Tax=Helobdella robusta TaxID=6412 RepID=T1FKJ1_HELRO|nr:hypothetical protein HELRODRAFT_184072 [Helobdella robusta]ESO08296.1 hypothetical protein HELRODRAFT_184072 [Helobdella robusta]
MDLSRNEYSENIFQTHINIVSPKDQNPYCYVDLMSLYRVGRVCVQSILAQNSLKLDNLDRFHIKLNLTLRKIRNKDIRNLIETCAQYPGQALHITWPMCVDCLDFELESRYVFLHLSNERYERTLFFMFMEVYEADAIYGCFGVLEEGHLQELYGLSYVDCGKQCKSKNFKFSAVKAEIECYCSNEFVVNNQISISECRKGHYKYYLVYDVDSDVIFEEATKVYHFCKNDLEISEEWNCESFKCLSNCSGSLCEIDAIQEMPPILYIGCFMYANCIEKSHVTSLDECIVFCKQHLISYLIFSMRNGHECYCSTHADVLLDSSMCNVTCGSDKKACGGLTLYSVYSSKMLLEDIVGCYSAEKINLEKAKIYFEDDYMTFTYCLSFCREHKSDHVALKNASMCVCGYLLDLFAPSDQVHISKCNMPCRDDSTKNCGATQAFSVYKDCSKLNGLCDPLTQCIGVIVNGQQRNECRSTTQASKLVSWKPMAMISSAIGLLIISIAVLQFYLHRRKLQKRSHVRASGSLPKKLEQSYLQ